MSVERRERYDCRECKQPFIVAYAAASSAEPGELAPVTCPHCSALNYVSVDFGAACSLDYRVLLVRRDAYRCGSCGGSFVTVYESEPDEPAEIAAVWCPRCGWLNYAAIAQSAFTRPDLSWRVEELRP